MAKQSPLTAVLPDLFWAPPQKNNTLCLLNVFFISVSFNNACLSKFYWIKIDVSSLNSCIKRLALKKLFKVPLKWEWSQVHNFFGLIKIWKQRQVEEVVEEKRRLKEVLICRILLQLISDGFELRQQTLWRHPRRFFDANCRVHGNVVNVGVGVGSIQRLSFNSKQWCQLLNFCIVRTYSSWYDKKAFILISLKRDTLKIWALKLHLRSGFLVRAVVRKASGSGIKSSQVEVIGRL